MISELAIRVLHETPSLAIRDVRCDGACRHRSAEECAGATYLVFPYSGLFTRHVGSNEAVGDANQLIFFNRDEAYSISHPTDGGDACLSLLVADEWLHELAPAEQIIPGDTVRFRRQHRGIDGNAQTIAARLRHRLNSGVAEPLETETAVFTLVGRSLGERTSNARPARHGRQKIVDRAKRVLASDMARRWTLAEVGREVGVSPVYLTQLFRQVEGVSLYRYHLRLRLARSLYLLADCDDLTGLALDLGFSSHSHFTAAFRQAYGLSPSAFQRSAGLR